MMVIGQRSVEFLYACMRQENENIAETKLCEAENRRTKWYEPMEMGESLHVWRTEIPIGSRAVYLFRWCWTRRKSADRLARTKDTVECSSVQAELATCNRSKQRQHSEIVSYRDGFIQSHADCEWTDSNAEWKMCNQMFTIGGYQYEPVTRAYRRSHTSSLAHPIRSENSVMQSIRASLLLQWHWFVRCNTRNQRKWNRNYSTEKDICASFSMESNRCDQNK